jgi:hypothetical protein
MAKYQIVLKNIYNKDGKIFEVQAVFDVDSLNNVRWLVF